MRVTLHVDGGSRGNPGPAACGVVVLDGNRRAVVEKGFFLGEQTNNVAEYQGLVRGLREAKEAGASAVDVVADSELMVKQINGQYRVKAQHLKPLFEQAMDLLSRFNTWTVTHTLREGNARADQLANLAMDKKGDVAPGL